MPHVVLVGDSIFDNAAYTEGGPDVVSQVLGLLPPGWEATLLAVDGATTEGVAGLLRRLPEQATHLVLSVGGNNALKHMGILETPVASMRKAVGVLADIASDFERRYRLAVLACLDTAIPLTVCTVYNGCFDDQFTSAVLRLARRRPLAQASRASAVLLAFLRWSDADALPTSSDSLKRPAMPRRTNRLSDPVLISSRFAALRVVFFVDVLFVVVFLAIRFGYPMHLCFAGCNPDALPC